MASTSYLPSSLLLRHNLHPSFIFCRPFLSISSPIESVPSRRKLPYPNSPCSLPIETTQRWQISAFRDHFLLLDANTVENSQELVSTSDDGAPSIISALLFVAFVGLSILTVGVIYIAVSDFLGKRERERFEKEEEAKKKKSGGKKGKIRSKARGGPRGFGQKIEEDDADDSD